jgi:hypothetical protein
LNWKAERIRNFSDYSPMLLMAMPMVPMVEVQQTRWALAHHTL